MTPEEKRLIGQAVRGNPDAINQVAEKYSAFVNRIAWRVVKNSADAADITQEVLLKLVASLPTLRVIGSLQAWIYRTTYRTSLNWLRTLRKLPPVESRDVAELPGDNPQHRQEWEEKLDRVADAAQALPVPYRILLKLFYFEDRSCREIADLMGSTEGAVRVQLHRARRMLRQALESRENTSDRLP